MAAPPLPQSYGISYGIVLLCLPRSLLLGDSALQSEDAVKKAWEAQREALTDDFKRKHRTALRHAAPKAKKARS